jgi:hypothetical protein
MQLIGIACVVGLAWLSFLGTAYGARRRLGLAMPASAACVVAVYGAWAAAAFARFGMGRSAWLASFGLLLPLVLGLALALLTPRRR